MNKEKILAALVILLVPAVLCAGNFKHSIDASYAVSAPVPAGYQVKKQSERGDIVTYEITRGDSKDFKGMISVIKAKELKQDPAWIKDNITRKGRALLSRAVEEKLTIYEVADGSRKGYYFRLTDKKPEPGGYKYLIQGMIFKEKSLVTFTLLFNINDNREVAKGLSIVTGLKVSFTPGVSLLEPHLLKPAEIPGDVHLGNKLFCKSIQVRTFYRGPEIYKGILPDVIEKKVQSVIRGSEKGSVIYIQFNGNAEGAQGFFTGLFYGGDGGPTSLHPEEFIIKKNMMIIFCFERDSTLKEAVKRVVLKN